jgi:subtilase family serine protease
VVTVSQFPPKESAVIKRSIVIGLAAGALACATVGASAWGAQAGSPRVTSPQQHASHQHASHQRASRLCSAHPRTGYASCDAMQVVTGSGLALQDSTPPSSAMTPSDIQSAYHLSGLSSGGATVAIVDAYGYANIDRDLGVFRSYFGLSACTEANGCLTVMNENGGSSLPATDIGWDGEQALDVDSVSSACPDCRIIVVEADSASFADLGTAVQTAAAQPGVVAISNSYGGGDAADSDYGAYYNHPGIAVTASTGDGGYQGASYPASSTYVTAVGGTTLEADGSARGWSESAWSGAGSGCSSVNTALSGAAGYDTGCDMRAMADVSAAADPNNGGLAVYYPSSDQDSSWGQIGGTSESSPIISSVYALSGDTSGYPNEIPYANSGALNDVTSGSNGSCSPTQWCQAGSGWDGPTGLGTPNGAGAF